MVKSNSFLIVLLIFTLLRLAWTCDFNLLICSQSYVPQGMGVGATYTKPIVSSIKSKIRAYFPSPHSELLLGILIGADDLKSVSRFNDVLIATGTIHVAVVSGYNINLVIDFIFKFLGSRYTRINLCAAITVAFIYAVISVFEPPVVRAWIFGMVLCFGRYYGRPVNGLKALVATACFMLVMTPLVVFSLSFQLSFLATLSLMMYAQNSSDTSYKDMLLDDLKTTLNAQILVWPLISYKFGRVSLLSPIVNSLSLWTIPLCTILGFIFLSMSYVSDLGARLLFPVLFFVLEVFVRVTAVFSKIPYVSVDYGMSTLLFAAYYIGALTYYVLRKFFKHAQAT